MVDSPRCSESDKVGHFNTNTMSVRAEEKTEEQFEKKFNHMR